MPGAVSGGAMGLLPATDFLQGQLAHAHRLFDFLIWLPASPYGWPVGLGVLLVMAGLTLGFIDRRSRLRERAARLQTWFDRTTEACFWLDADLQVLESNAAAASLIAGTRRSRRRALRHLLEAADVDVDTLLEELAEEEVVRRSLHVEDEDGARRLDLELQRITARGKTTIMAVMRDMTDYDKAHRLLRQFNRQVLDALPVRVVVMTPSGEYLYANRQIAPGRKAQNWLRGKTDFEYCRELGLHPEIALRRRSQRKLAVNRGKHIPFEECIRMPDGSERHYKRVYAPIFDLNDEVTAVVGCGVDVTEQKRIEQHAAELEVDKEQFERFKEALLENVNHELRTPLTGIIGSAQVLEQEVDQEVAEFAGAIVQNGRRLTQTLDALVELATIESTGGRSRPRLLSLRPVLRSVVEELEPLAEEKGLFLRCNEGRGEALLRVDADSLHRVLHSLIGNAVKFTETGGVLIEVEMDAEGVRIRVMDTGVGIDNAFLPHLFDAFHQESSGTSRAFEGIGLGLTVVRRHLDLMGASVSVDSEKGEGSMFTIAFPHRFPNALAPDPQKPRILLFSGDADVRRSIGHQLDPYVRFDTARSMREVGEKSYLQSCDAVLMPVAVDPERAAGEVLQELRRRERLETVPVIALDPRGMPNGREHLMDVGFDGYVDQPFERMPLLDALCTIFDAEDEGTGTSNQ